MKKRKLLSVLLATSLSVSLVMPTFAADVTQSEDTANGQVASKEITTREADTEWNVDDFTYEDIQGEDGAGNSAKITGLSDSGKAKRVVNPNLVMPNETKDGKTITAIADATGTDSYGLFGAENELLTSVILPEKIETIGNFSFRNCGLEEINFPETLTTIGQAAFQTNKLKNIILPDSVTTVGGGAFASNFALEKVKISKGMTVIPATFVGCIGVNIAPSFKEIEIPEGITTIDSNAFVGNSFEKVEIPKTVTQIKGSAFMQSDQHRTLKDVVLHEGLTSIGSSAFSYTLVKKIKIPSTVTTLNKAAFNFCAIDGEKVKIYAYDKKQVGSTTKFISESDNHTTVYALTEEISRAESLNEGDYKKADWVALCTKLEAAKAIDAKEDATVEEIRQASDDLEATIDALEKKSISKVTVSPKSLSEKGGEVQVTVEGNLDENVWYVLQKKETDGSYTSVDGDVKKAGVTFSLTIPENTEKKEVTYVLKVKDREPEANADNSGYNWDGATEATITVAAIPEEPTKPTKPADPSKPTNPSEPTDSSKPSGSNDPTVSTVKVSKINLSAISKKVAAGKKIKMLVSVAPSNASNKTVEWKTSNSKYATVNQSGVVSTKKAGAGKTVTVTATAKDGSGIKASYRLSILKDFVKSIKLKAKKTVKAGKSLKVKATVKTTGKKVNKKLKWTSSNEKYATVSSKGVVKAKKAGKGKTVRITAASTDGSNKKKVIKIKIK